MELFSSNIKISYIFLCFRKQKPREKFLIFQEMKTLKKLLTFQEMELFSLFREIFYILGNGNPQNISYIS